MTRKPERSRLLPPGQRGSGVEIVLLVEDVDAVYRQAQQVRADIVRPLADYPWHMRQFWVRHPDGYLLRPAQRILSVNPTTYRRQVADAFQRDTPRITEELLAVKQTANRLAQQEDVLGAATIYEILVTEIFEQSHLYYHEEAVYDDYYEEEGYYPEEEGLEEFVRESIEALGSYLADEQTDRVAREKSIAVLLAVYRRDLHADDSHGFAERAAEQLVRYTTPLERQTIAEWIRAALADEEQAIADSERQAYGKFWLDLQHETLDDEAYLRICRETGRTADLVERLLALGRIDEAAQDLSVPPRMLRVSCCPVRRDERRKRNLTGASWNGSRPTTGTGAITPLNWRWPKRCSARSLPSNAIRSCAFSPGGSIAGRTCGVSCSPSWSKPRTPRT